jgi:hypothetical protein
MAPVYFVDLWGVDAGSAVEDAVVASPEEVVLACKSDGVGAKVISEGVERVVRELSPTIV